MKPASALAEDFRRVGVALIIGGLVGAFLKDQASAGAAVVAAALGIGFCGAGYWIHRKE